MRIILDCDVCGANFSVVELGGLWLNGQPPERSDRVCPNGHSQLALCTPTSVPVPVCEDLIGGERNDCTEQFAAGRHGLVCASGERTDR